VSVTVREKQLVGYVKCDDMYWYFDRSGVVRVGSSMNESAYKARLNGETLPRDTEAAGSASDDVSGGDNNSYPEADSSGSNDAETDSTAVYMKAGNYLADEDTYVEADTAEYGDEYGYDEDADYEDDYDEDNDYDEGDDYDEGNDYEDGNEYEDGYDGGDGSDEYDGYGNYEEDGEQNEDGGDETILIQPELTDDTAPTPIPADESSVSAVTPIPAEEVLVKEYVSEDTFEKNYIPEITGLIISDAAVGERLPVRYSSIYSALGALKSFAEENAIYPTSVDVSDKGNLQIHFNDVTVNLGDGSYIEKRLDVFKHIIYELLGRSGTLHLENYDGTQSRLIFSKNEKNS
jgi:hypothetical protein